MDIKVCGYLGGGDVDIKVCGYLGAGEMDIKVCGYLCGHQGMWLFGWW